MRRQVPRLIVGALLASSLALLVASLARLSRDDARRASPPPVIADREQAIDAFETGEALAEGGRIAYRLAPLYPDVERQAFEARALRDRLALGEGEPWRLVRTVEGAGRAVPDDPSEVEVRDDDGSALRPIDPQAPGSGPRDPVRVVFSTPAGARSGEAVEWLLWGRRPGSRAELVLGHAPRALPLDSTRVRRADLDVPLARLEAPKDGKKAPADASEGSRDRERSERR